MDNFDMFSNWNKIFEDINRITNPLNNFNWITKMNSNISELASIDLLKGFQSNIYHSSLHDGISENLNWINSIHSTSIIDSINKSIGININTEILNKIDSSNYWSNVAKLGILDKFQAVINENELEDVLLNISDNIDLINSNLESIDRNSIEFFNNVCFSIKSYIDKNPSIKYSSIFIIWLISTLIIPILLNKDNIPSNDENKSINIEVSSINTTNNNYSNSVIAKINVKTALLKNFPRDKSKTVYQFKKNEEVQILKDSLKWALVIKTNSIESGWIRKEYLTFKK